ncbi:unnamed protein product [Gongylonema pulchrum]|uniref:Inorganic phosphate cotransporter n=1 Tax=Gongylonema pulchrum TaxID=637853 RepID=A0A183EFZ5_9BILA|nr:unnamed protein product [Gongylonema pulchrum]
MTGQAAQMFTMPLAAFFCVTVGWPYAFYTHALLSVLLAFVFAAVYHNSPAQHPLVSDDEFFKITEGMLGVPVGRTGASAVIPPASQLVVKLILSAVADHLNCFIGRTGASAVIPPASQLVVKLILSAVADHLNCFSERLKLQFFNTLSMVGCALWLIPLGFLSRRDDVLALLCFTASISCIAFETCGSMKSATLIARNFTQFVMAVAQVHFPFVFLVSSCVKK